MLLVEYTILDNLQVINENTAGGVKKLKLRGRFQKCDEQNNNGRIYPRKILEGQVQKIQEKIKDRSLVGALDHPANDAIHLSQASHLITGLSVNKTGDVIGECEILSTPNGKIVESLINDGVKIGISSRGVGSVSEGREGKIVNEDFKLITFDLVSDPSTKGAFPELTESIRENSQRAQAIISKHRKDRVLMTMLESKVSEKLGEVKRRNKKARRAFYASLDPKAKKGEKGLVAAGRKAFRQKMAAKAPLKSKAQAEIDARKKFAKQPTAKQAGEPQGKEPIKKSGQVGRRYFKNKDIERQERERKDDSIDIRATVLEAFKRVCWGDRYDEGVLDNPQTAIRRLGRRAAVQKALAQKVKQTADPYKKVGVLDSLFTTDKYKRARAKFLKGQELKRRHSRATQRSTRDVAGADDVSKMIAKQQGKLPDPKTAFDFTDPKNRKVQHRFTKYGGDKK